MKVKINLEENETLEEAEQKLEKALKMKQQSRKEYFEAERYADQHVEDLHERVVKDHEELLKRLIDKVADEIKKDIK